MTTARVVMEPRTIYLDAHAMRRHERLSALKEAAGAVLLLSTGVDALTAGGVSGLVILDFLVGAGVLGVAIRELQRGRKLGVVVRWLDVGVGGLLIAEAMHLTDEGHHHQSLILLYYGTGLAYCLAGVFHRQLGRRRYVRIDDDGIQVRLNLIRRFRLSWPDIVRVVGYDSRVEIHTRTGGRYEIEERYLPNLREVRALLLERASGRGIATK